MSDPSSSRTDPKWRPFMICCAVAEGGGFVNCLGWYLFHSRPVAMVGFFVGAAGVVAGGFSIVLLQVQGVAHLLNRDKETDLLPAAPRPAIDPGAVLSGPGGEGMQER